MKLSIVIPVYNVAPYLRKSVESVMKQDLSPEEYEIILVDDGSTDGSGELCDELVRLSPIPQKAKVIHQKNAGLSAARNAGIAVATGEYIQFVDSDDYLEPNVLGGLVRQMDEEKLDVLRFDYQNVRITNRTQDTKHQTPGAEAEYEVFEPNKTPRKVDQCKDIVDGETYLNTRMQTACYAVQFMIRRKILDGCVFTLGIFFEDIDWTPRMLLKAKRVNSTTTIVYNYLTREGSITNAVEITKHRKVLEDMIRLLGVLQQMSEGITNSGWFKKIQDAMVLSILGMVSLNFWEDRKCYLKQLKELKVYPLYSSGYKYKLVNINPKLYCFLVRLKNT